MEWKQILIWLIIFIVGSLIVSFLIYPQSFQSFTSNIKSVSISKVFSGVGTISIKDLIENKDTYLRKEITIKGKRGLSPLCLIETPCCRNLGSQYKLYEEDKVTIPSSKYSIPLKMQVYSVMFGDEWKCQGKLEKATFTKGTCAYSGSSEEEREADNCDTEPTEDCYYFNASSCECLSDNC